MRRRLGLPLLLGLAASLAFSSAAQAATLSSTYWIQGFEYSATTTVGRFAGTATGSAGDGATWNAVVEHTALITTASITGGYADLLTSNLVQVHGSFSGGSVDLVGEEAGCGSQTYSVIGTLKKVSRSDLPRKGKGMFEATLVHYRASVLGACIVYSASVTGAITLDF
jgi:hypothetical protein